MKTIYKLSDFEFIKKTPNLAFLLTNQKGGYLYLWPTPQSRYEGWFLNLNINGKNKLLKILDRIHCSCPLTKEIETNFYQVKRTCNDFSEIFFTEDNFLHWQADKEVEANLLFDPREIFNNPESGRFFEAEEYTDSLLIQYTQKNEFNIFIALYPKPKIFKFKNKWQEIEYPLDKKRNSPPFKKYLNNTLSIAAKEFTLATSTNKQEALAMAKLAYQQKHQTLERKRKEIEKLLKLVPKRLKGEDFLAYFASLWAIKNLVVENKYLYAGLPWFCQPWSRDTAISLGAVLKLDVNMAKTFMFNLLENILADGFVKATLNDYSPLKSSDAIYFLFKQIETMLGLKIFKPKEVEHIKTKLTNTIDSILKNHEKDKLIFDDNKLETWMDTTPRAGARIEIQAGQLLLYKLAAELGIRKYDQKYSLLKVYLSNIFLDKEKLYDGKDDPTQRPNIFLAYFLYPELLDKHLWEKVVNFNLLRLWLEWGGLATIDKNSRLYQNEYTGENNLSYHNGDSWFWINNLAALTMLDLDKEYYSLKIKKIFQASKNNLLWLGALGWPSELSSAKELRAEGALGQLWSAATLIYLLDKI